MRRFAIALLAVIVASASSTCRKAPEIAGVELTVGFAEKNLTDNLITDVQYRFKTAADFQKLDQDYSVFVHFWHNNNLLFQDDYVPNPPVSAWEPNREYTTVHQLYIPAFIDEFDPQFNGEETLRLAVGLYSPYDRTGKSKVELLERKLKVVPPPPDTPEIVYEEGWFDLEIDPAASLKQWRWTAREARCLIDNPGRDALLVIRGGVNKEALPDQKVIVKLNDTVLDEFTPAEAQFDKSYKIKEEMMGDRNEFYLTITTDKTFTPAQLFPNSVDNRELAMQISFIYFR